MHIRSDKRRSDQLRTITMSYNQFSYAPGSILFELGNTRILCAVSLQAGVPHYMRGKGSGWLSAEYAMLPTATHERTAREATTGKRNGRSVEISRLIGRALRSIVNLDVLGEKTITIDCDVLQADGSTRTACITAASLALKAAQTQWLADGTLKGAIMQDEIAAVSVGLLQGMPLLDLNYAEDSTIDADFNVVMTKTGKLVELQGCGEQAPLSWEQFDVIRHVAIKGIEQLFSQCKALVPPAPEPGLKHNPFKELASR